MMFFPIIDKNVLASLDLRRWDGEYVVQVTEEFVTKFRDSWSEHFTDEKEAHLLVLDDLGRAVNHYKSQTDIRSQLIALEDLSDLIVKHTVSGRYILDRMPPDDANAGFVHFMDRECQQCEVRYPAIMYREDTVYHRICIRCFFGLEPKSPMPNENPITS